MAFATDNSKTTSDARARAPSDHGWSVWKTVLWRVKERLGEENVSLVAAGVAFYALLALFPGIAALVAIGGIVSEPVAIGDQIEPLVALLPEAAREIILGQVNEVAAAGGESGLGIAAVAGFIFALYSASKGISNLMSGLNVAYEEEEARGFLKVKLVSFALTLFVVTIGLAALLIVAVIPALLALFAGFGGGELLLQVIRWPALLMLGVILFLVLYRFGPSREDAEWRWLAPGGIAACALWVLGTVGFAIYVQNFGTYNETFGTLGGVVILLTWLWLSAFVTLIGAMIDAELEAQTVTDTTTGVPQPPGSRGAEKADDVPDTQS